MGSEMLEKGKEAPLIDRRYSYWLRRRSTSSVTRVTASR